MAKSIPRILVRSLVVSFLALPYLAAFSVALALLAAVVRADGNLTLRQLAAMCSDLPRWWTLLQNSVVVGGSATVIAVLAGLGYAVATFKIAWPGRPVMLLLVLAGACVPTYVTSSAMLSVIGITEVRESAWVAGIIHGVTYVPLAALLMGLGLAHVEPELEDAASLEAPASRVLLSISIPRAAWSIAATALIVFWLVLTDYSITDVLQVRTFAEEVFTQYQLGGWGGGAVLPAVPMMLICCAAFVMLVRRAQLLATPLFQGQSTRIQAQRVGVGGHAVCWGLLAVVLIGIALVCTELVGRITVTRAKWWLDASAIWPEWQNTVIVCMLTGFVTAVLAVGVAWLWSRSRRWRGVSAAVMLILVAVPAPTLAMTVYSWFGYAWPAGIIQMVDGLYDGLGIYVVVLVLRFLPVAVLVVMPAVQRVPMTLEEAATMDGADWWMRLTRLYWPECRGNAGLAAVVVMILAVGELSCVNIVAPPGMGMLSTRLFSFLHSGVDSQAATVCLAAALTALAPAMVLFAAMRRKFYSVRCPH